MPLILNIAGQQLQAIDFRRQARGYRRLAGIAPGCHIRRRPRRVAVPHLRDLVAAKEPMALRQGLRMADHLFDVGQGCSRKRQQLMVDGQKMFGTDGQLVAVQQQVYARDPPRGGVFNRDHRAIGFAQRRGLHRRLKTGIGHGGGLGVKLLAGQMGKGTPHTLKSQALNLLQRDCSLSAKLC